MATIVNTPAAGENVESSSGSMMNLFFGVVIVLLVVGFLLYIGLPMMRSVGSAAQAPQVNVPDKINVDVNAPQGGGNPAPAQ